MAEETSSLAADAAGVARDERDARGDAVTAQLLKLFEDLQVRVMTHMDEESQIIRGLASGLAELTARTEQFLLAFPGGDAKTHCEYHQLLIDTARDKAEFWKKMRYDLIRWGLFGLAGWALYAMWKAFLLGPK